MYHSNGCARLLCKSSVSANSRSSSAILCRCSCSVSRVASRNLQGRLESRSVVNRHLIYFSRASLSRSLCLSSCVYASDVRAEGSKSLLIIAPPLLRDSSSASMLATFSCNACISDSAFSARSSAISLSNIDISSCSWASNTRLSFKD